MIVVDALEFCCYEVHRTRASWACTSSSRLGRIRGATRCGGGAWYLYQWFFASMHISTISNLRVFIYYYYGDGERMWRHQVPVMVGISGWPSGPCSPFAPSVLSESRHDCQGPTQKSVPLQADTWSLASAPAEDWCIWCFHIFLTVSSMSGFERCRAVVTE